MKIISTTNLFEALRVLDKYFSENEKHINRIIIPNPERKTQDNSLWEMKIDPSYILSGHKRFNHMKFMIKKVIFAKPKTIVLWADGSKTIVTAQKGEKFDKEKGVLMAYYKKYNGRNYMKDLDEIIANADDIETKRKEKPNE